MPYIFSIIRIFLVSLGLLTVSFFNLLKSLGGYEHPGDKFGFVLGSVLGAFGLSLLLEFILFLMTRKGRDQVKKSYQKKENLEDLEHIAKQSYFSDVEIEKMEEKFLNFGELLFNALKLFRRSWLKAWLRPVLWVLLLLLSFVFGAFVLGLFFTLIYNILIIYNNYIALIILFLVIAAVAISAYLLLIWGLIQANIRNLVLIDNKNATFWRHGFDIWSIFCKRLGVAFLFFSINFAFTILYLQLQILNLFIDYRNALSWIVLLAYASLVAWFNYTLFVILTLVTFKDFNVMQSVRASLGIIKGNFKRIFYRYFWISLLGVLVMTVLFGTVFLVINQIYAYNLKDGFSDLIFVLEGIFVVAMTLLFFWIFYTIFYYIQYISFVNLIHFVKLKDASYYNWTGRKYKLFNITAIISIFALLFQFSYYPVLAKDFELRRQQDIYLRFDPHVYGTDRHDEFFSLGDSVSDSQVVITVDEFYPYQVLKTENYCVVSGSIKNLTNSVRKIYYNPYTFRENNFVLKNTYALGLPFTDLMMDIESLQTKNFTNIYLCQALESSSYTFTALNSNRGSEPFKFKLNLDLSKLIKSKFEKNSLLNTKAELEEKLKERTLSQKFKIEPSGKLTWVNGLVDVICKSKVKISNLSDSNQVVYANDFILSDKADPQRRFNQAWFGDQKPACESLSIEPGESKDLNLQFACESKIKKYTLNLANSPVSLDGALSVDVSF